MSHVGNARWAIEEFGHADIADRRWVRRLGQMAERALRRPAGRISETFRDGAQRQGAYKFLESDAVDPTAPGVAMNVACARRAAAEEFVFCAVDGSSLTLADHARGKDFGPIGTRSQGARGLKVMSAMMLSPDGVPIGISAQEWWARRPTAKRKHHDRLAPKEKESGKWLKAMRQTRAVMAQHAPKTRCWFQLDREGDAWPVLKEAGEEGHWFTIRASWNRRVLDSKNRKRYLRSSLARQRVVATYSLEVKPSAKRSARQARMEIRACAVVLDLKDKKLSKRHRLTVNVVHAVERGTTPKGEKPIDWLLYTNRSIKTTKNLKQVLFGYSMRWRIEELHRAWKSGACRVEQTQLRSAAAVIKWATILAAVAVRVERIKQLSREAPARPATDEFSAVELKAIQLLRFEEDPRNRPPPGTIPTLGQATLWLAQIGGYIGGKSSGPPGSVTIARGLQDVQAAVRTLNALAPTTL